MYLVLLVLFFITLKFFWILAKSHCSGRATLLKKSLMEIFIFCAVWSFQEYIRKLSKLCGKKVIRNFFTLIHDDFLDDFSNLSQSIYYKNLCIRTDSRVAERVKTDDLSIAQKFFIKAFLSKFDQIHSFLQKTLYRSVLTTFETTSDSTFYNCVVAQSSAYSSFWTRIFYTTAHKLDKSRHQIFWFCPTLLEFSIFLKVTGIQLSLHTHVSRQLVPVLFKTQYFDIFKVFTKRLQQILSNQIA